MQLPLNIAQNLKIAIGTVCNIRKCQQNLSDRDKPLILGILYEDCTSYLSEIR